MKTFKNLNGTESLVEMNWKNFEKVKKNFRTVLKIDQKITCGFIETLQAEIIKLKSFIKFFLHFKMILQ